MCWGVFKIDISGLKDIVTYFERDGTSYMLTDSGELWQATNGKDYKMVTGLPVMKPLKTDYSGYEFAKYMIEKNKET